MKLFYVQFNIGKVKYVVNYHDGVQTHDDGSPFYGIATFSNKKKMGRFITDLCKQGYRERACGL